MKNKGQQMIEKFDEVVNDKYPPNSFSQYVNENRMDLVRGVQEDTYIRQMTDNEREFIDWLHYLRFQLIKVIKGKNEF